MQLKEITLQMDKSIAIISNFTRTIRQDEMGQILPVKLVNSNGQPYDLTGRTLMFSESKKGNKAVIDNSQDRFSVTNATNGQFSYTLHSQVYGATGVAYFSIIQGNTIIDSTQNFKFIVLPSAAGTVDNGTYVSGLDAVIDKAKQQLATAQNEIDQILNQITIQKNNVDSLSEKLTADYNSTKQNLAKQFDDKMAVLNQQLTDYQAKYNQLSSDWAKSLQSITAKAGTDTQNAVDAINQKYTDDFNKLKSGFSAWQTTTTKTYTDQVNAIIAKVKSNESTVANVQKLIDNMTSRIDELKKQFNQVDWTQYVTSEQIKNYYTKAEVDSKLATAGKVKTVQKIQPDDAGDIEVPIIKKFDSPQAAYEASKNGNFIAVYDMNDGSQSAIIGDQTVTIQTLYDAINSLNSTVVAHSSSISDLQTQVATSKNTIADIQDAIKNMAASSTITNIQNRLTEDDSDISKLQTDNTANKKNISTNTTDIANLKSNSYTKTEVDSKLATAGKVKTVQKIQPDEAGDIEVPIIKKFDSPQAAYEASKNGNFIAVYDMNDGQQAAVIGDKTVTIQTLNDALIALQNTVSANTNTISSLQKEADQNKTDIATKANPSDIADLNSKLQALTSNIGDQYVKKSEVLSMFWHKDASEAAADTDRKNNPDVPLISW